MLSWQHTVVTFNMVHQHFVSHGLQLSACCYKINMVTGQGCSVITNGMMLPSTQVISRLNCLHAAPMMLGSSMMNMKHFMVLRVLRSKHTASQVVHSMQAWMHPTDTATTKAGLLALFQYKHIAALYPPCCCMLVRVSMCSRQLLLEQAVP